METRSKDKIDCKVGERKISKRRRQQNIKEQTNKRDDKVLKMQSKKFVKSMSQKDVKDVSSVKN